MKKLLVFIIVIFFISDGFFIIGGKKKIYAKVWKINKLLRPLTKVENIPYPNIG